jgi:hypothetical protein
MNNCNGNCMYGKCDCEESHMKWLLSAQYWTLVILCVLMALALGLLVVPK